MFLAKFQIKGHSMEPFLKPRQSVLVSPIPFIFSKPKVGDVVVFKLGDKFYVKRIKQIKSQEYFLEGDNPDDSLDSKRLGWIKREDIIGKIILKF